MPKVAKASLVIGALLLAQAFYMDAKALLAQILIAHSWTAADTHQLPPVPWPWADTRAIARLEVPTLDKTLFVMQDASGESLAFGPGHLPTSAAPGDDGHVVISGHRDTHFKFLQDLQIGQLISLENYGASRKRYQVVDTHIIDTDTQTLTFSELDQLTLITCYPFQALIPAGPLRFIVTAIAI